MVPRFRVWDKETKKMWNIEIWHIEDEYVDLIEPSKNVADFTAERAWRKQSDIILMQSTGLKDKNGVDIFEGDVVAIKYSEYGYHYYEKIVFENGTFTAGDEDWLYNIKDYCVVCGNIYENPELLEPANEN